MINGNPLAPGFRGNTQTFRDPGLRAHQHQPHGPTVRNYQFETLDKNIEAIISLPEGEDKIEWFAYNVFDFHRQVTMLFSAITEYCTTKTCPVMTAGSGYKYLWSEQGSKPCEVSAPEYISRLLKWIQNLLDDENIFPSTPGVLFKSNIESVIRTIMKRLFRVYAHFYYHHLHHFKMLQIEIYLNTSFKHFILFNKRYKLIDPASLDPLRDLVNFITRN